MLRRSSRPADVCPDRKWTTLAELADRYLPEAWRRVLGAHEKAGHGGSDYFVVNDLADVVTGLYPVSIDLPLKKDRA